MKAPSGGLTPPSQLRRLKFDSNTAAKFEVVVAAGDELEVSEDVAAQLQRAGNFRDPADVPEPGPRVVLDENGEVDYEASPPEALAMLGLTQPVGTVDAKSSKAELVAYAEASGIDLGDAKTKAEIVAVLFPPES